MLEQEGGRYETTQSYRVWTRLFRPDEDFGV